MIILIIDDEPAVCKMLEVFVKTLGDCEPLCFASPAKALQWCLENEPDLVLVDYMMPEMNGIDFIRRFRLLKDREDIPVIMITATNEKDLCYEALNVGANDFLGKPVDGIELHARLKNMLSLRSSRKKLADTNRYLETIVAQEIALNLSKDRAIMKQSQMAVLGQLAASITHEINTPLTYIKGDLELLKQECSSLPLSNRTETNELIGAVEDGVRRISDIIESMKDICRYSTREKVPADVFNTILCSARMVLNRARHIAPVFINGKPLDKRKFRPREEFTAELDVQSIEQLWIILLNNSLDALQSSSLPFEERYIRVLLTRSGGRIRTTISDNGGGISADLLDTIFEPFTSSKQQGGMGLGLHIAKTIVDNHGGNIKARNDENGAVFEVLL